MKNKFEQAIITIVVAVVTGVSIFAYKSTPAQSPTQYDYNNINRERIVTVMPEEMPVEGDVLVVEYQRGDSIFLAYPLPGSRVPQPAPKMAVTRFIATNAELFPNWREADKECGKEGRGSDLWCEIASGE